MNKLTNENEHVYLSILKEELVPAMGCTEPIAIAYCAAKAKDVLEQMPDRVCVEVSGNIIKNVKSVIVPNTNGLKGIAASAVAGIVGGRSEKVLEVIADVTAEEKTKMKEFLESVPVEVKPLDSEEQLDIIVTLFYKDEYASVRISGFHTNIVQVKKDDHVLYESGVVAATDVQLTDRSLLNVKEIYDFAESVDLSSVKELLDRQIAYNWAIAEEGLTNPYGANIGKVLLNTEPESIKTRQKRMRQRGLMQE